MPYRGLKASQVKGPRQSEETCSLPDPSFSDLSAGRGKAWQIRQDGSGRRVRDRRSRPEYGWDIAIALLIETEELGFTAISRFSTQTG